MNGDRSLLDTNAVVSLLRGGASALQAVDGAAWIGVSVVSQIEFLPSRP